ncbi:hypothetical protein BCV69DRAFT_296420 [Microstroma glucosiphilum]|uniref:F-box domain-containing protein n=1 Tax=Pseudomicrostroma glucosiphilum TaxID=1684307 RepID=A0A316UFT6_9BASI|nr:hypothetical protein BCV69DRAFT_296420 [Pseudomicrostroma glucosiphilum]PWN24122.1 hypothetical protein BCV69DRAFT_296420 [Pseudomicrostroma glucosiphilum]
MLIDALPFELLAAILGNLDDSTALTCRRVSKAWNHVARSDAVLRSICQNMGYLKSGQSLEELRSPQPRLLGSPLTLGHLHSRGKLYGRPESDLESYETFLRTSCLLRDAWPHHYGSSGSSNDGMKDWAVPAIVRTYDDNFRPMRRYGMWRVKYDAAEDCFIHTRGNGPGIGVTDASTGELLFFYRGVRQRAHLEYDQGWVVHDTRGRDHFQIWRFERIVEDVQQPRRGILRKYGSLRCPYGVRAYRMHFPHLAVATQNSRIVVYNVPEKRIVQDLPMYPAEEATLAASSTTAYIEFDREYIFVLSEVNTTPDWLASLFIYSRSSGSRVCRLSREQLESKAPCYLRRRLDSDHEFSSLEGGAEWRQAYAEEIDRLATARDDDGGPQWSNGLSAVHHDESTGALIILGSQVLFIIQDYQALCKQASEQDGQVSNLKAMRIVSQRRWSHQSTLAVAEGRLAFTYESGLMLGDIRSLLWAIETKASSLLDQTLWQYVDFSLDFEMCPSLHMDSTSLTAVGVFNDYLLSYEPTIASTREVEANQAREAENDPGWVRHEDDFTDDEDEPSQRFVRFDFGHLSRTGMRRVPVKRRRPPPQTLGTIICYPGARPLTELLKSGEVQIPEKREVYDQEEYESEDYEEEEHVSVGHQEEAEATRENVQAPQESNEGVSRRTDLPEAGSPEENPTSATQGGEL